VFAETCQGLVVTFNSTATLAVATLEVPAKQAKANVMSTKRRIMVPSCDGSQLATVSFEVAMKVINKMHQVPSCMASSYDPS
jgi:hypothetical protein